MADREAILDALMDGASIEAIAKRVGLHKAEVQAILKEETANAYDGEALRSEWTLTARRLRRMELAFDRKAIDDLDCTAAIVAIKASERRASLTGANAQQGHLVTVMRMRRRSKSHRPAPRACWRRYGSCGRAIRTEPSGMRSTSNCANEMRQRSGRIEGEPDPDQRPAC
jgi:hypothetical protein